MKIWIINHYAVPPTSAGGTRHYHFAKQLILRGHDVTLIAANYNHFSHTFMQPKSQAGHHIDQSFDVPFIWIPTPAYYGNTIARFWNMLIFSWRLLQKKYLSCSSPPDLIIGSSPHLFAALSAELLARRLKIPFILEIRDIWPDTLVELGRFSERHPLIKMMKYIEHYLYKRADKIITLLPEAHQYFIKKGVKEDDIMWLPNAIDSDLIPSHLEHNRQDKFTIMYAGAHGLANDLDTVLKAGKILQNQGLSDKIRILLIGEGPEKNRLKQIASQQDITIVEFINAVPKQEIYTILNKADAFLMLLKKSPLFRWGISPNKLFDYLAMARPIIFGVDTNYNPIEKYNAGLSITPSCHESLANAISQLALLPEIERAEMGQRGKDFVMQHHHIQHLTNSLVDAMTDTLESKLNKRNRDR